MVHIVYKGELLLLTDRLIQVLILQAGRLSQ